MSWMKSPRGSRGPSLSGNRTSPRRGGASFGATTRAPPAPKPLGSLLHKISIDSLLIEEEAPEVENAHYVSSYNWLDTNSPIILVPGSPPAFTPPATDPQLRPDSGSVFRDTNAARYPDFPMEPAIRSIKALQPGFDLNAVDVIGCGSTLGNLLRFAGSTSRPFRFDVDVVEDTVLFIRRENSSTELITDLVGYGHTFPEAYTTWDDDVRNSCSHQRIVEYEFGGLKFLIRSETDGYVRASTTKRRNADNSSLTDALDKITVTSATPSSTQKLNLQMQGTKVNQDQIFDLKTRSKRNVFDLNEILPRLWVNQTPNFLLAYHQYGLFDAPKVKDIRKDIADWQRENANLLGRLHAIIRQIVDLVRDLEEPQVEVSWDGEGPLNITKQIGGIRRAVPADLVDTWAII